MLTDGIIDTGYPMLEPSQQQAPLPDPLPYSSTIENPNRIIWNDFPLALAYPRWDAPWNKE